MLIEIVEIIGWMNAMDECDATDNSGPIVYVNLADRGFVNLWLMFIVNLLNQLILDYIVARLSGDLLIIYTCN